ncbi:hypothetical protein [Gryllotalpicola koreensis]|uniref:DoxX family membrane protein n=1 Tax=Gryllotalpicola koreensis TaxID=993086 RepID=A0ABP7ZQE0_9MICO
MAPLVVLLVVTGLVRLIGWLTGLDGIDSWSAATAYGLAVMFVMTSGTHFVPRRRAGFVAIVPPAIPAPGLVVTVTGVFEIAGAIGLLIPQTRVLAAVCLGLLLLVMFPANVYAAGAQRHPNAPHTPLLPRTVYQLMFLAAIIVTIWGS